MSDDLSTCLRQLFARPREPRGRPPTLREVARETGLSVSYLWRLKTGRTRNPTKKVLEKLASFFQVPVSQLTGESFPESSDVRARSFDVEKALRTGFDRLYRADLEGALELAQEAEAATRAEADRALKARAFLLLGVCHAAGGELAAARTALDQALSHIDEADSGPVRAEALLLEAALADHDGRAHDAYFLAREARTLLERRQMQPHDVALRCLLHLGIYARRLGRPAEGLQHFESAASLAENAENGLVMLAPALVGMGLSLIEVGRSAEAVAPLERARDLYLQLKMPSEVATAYHNLGLAFEGLQRWEEAAEALTKSFAIREALGLTEKLGFCAMELGLCYAHLHRGEKALQYAYLALDIARARSSTLMLGWAYLHLGLTYRALGQLELARKAMEEAIATFGQLGRPAEMATARRDYGDLLVESGQMEEAVEAYREAIQLLLPSAPGRLGWQQVASHPSDPSSVRERGFVVKSDPVEG